MKTQTLFYLSWILLQVLANYWYGLAHYHLLDGWTALINTGAYFKIKCTGLSAKFYVNISPSSCSDVSKSKFAADLANNSQLILQ